MIYTILYWAKRGGLRGIEWSPEQPDAKEHKPWQFCPYCGEEAVDEV
jgi:hypothetical protein